MKSVLQSEAAECGLASLAMILAWHGHDCTLRELRRRFSQLLRLLKPTEGTIQVGGEDIAWMDARG